MLHIRQYLWGIACLLLVGCQSLDDDSAYAIGNKASFFLVENPISQLSIYRYANQALETDWNVKAGVSNVDLSDAEIRDNRIWLANTSQKTLLEVNPTDARVEEKFAGLPLTPHYFAVGRKQIMVADTVAHKLAMVKRRNGDVQILEFDQKPGRCLYNSGKFYLVQNDSLMAIYDEEAMTTRAVLALNMVVDELMLNRYHVIIAMGHDSATTREALIDANGDLLIRGSSFAVSFTKLRPTPYFAAQFGTEYLADLTFGNSGVVNDTNVIVWQHAEDFEADFFESKIYYLWQGHLVVRDIASKKRLDSLAFPGKLVKGMYQYAD